MECAPLLCNALSSSSSCCITVDLCFIPSYACVQRDEDTIVSSVSNTDVEDVSSSSSSRSSSAVAPTSAEAGVSGSTAVPGSSAAVKPLDAHADRGVTSGVTNSAGARAGATAALQQHCDSSASTLLLPQLLRRVESLSVQLQQAAAAHNACSSSSSSSGKEGDTGCREDAVDSAAIAAATCACVELTGVV
jgi:hypothetical protein